MSAGYGKRRNNSSYIDTKYDKAGNKGGRTTLRSSVGSKFSDAISLHNTNTNQDAEFGYEGITPENCKQAKLGWLFNFETSLMTNEETNSTHTCLNLYFVQEDGSGFRSSLVFSPYFLVFVADLTQAKRNEVETFLMKRFDGLIAKVDVLNKEDLELQNHLSGLKNPYLKLSFHNESDMLTVRNALRPIIASNIKNREESEAYGQFAEVNRQQISMGMSHVAVTLANKRKMNSILDSFLDLREYDVPYDQRVCIDTGLRVGLWYEVASRRADGGIGCEVKLRPELVERPILKILAYDIETTKLPLKFPNAEFDKVMMISYMCDGMGYLIVNREIVSQDIEDFDYTPKPEYPGPFIIFNEADEKAVLVRFFNHVKELRPQVIVTYNGDYFDMPFVDTRATANGLSMKKEIGLSVNRAGEYDGRYFVHLDAFYWVKRDSYLPQGSQGLKAVTKAKLKYNPTELDPEDMLPFASEKPQVLAAYSVSDAVATYYLYMKYVHLFIFSLCNIIPLSPKDILRKGSGTLCETLLMVQAYEANVVCPNKQKDELTQFYKGHLLESQTYIGGHVECLESGVFRADLPYKFNVDPKTLQELIDDLDNTLKFAIEDEAGKKMSDIINYTEVRDQIKKQLEHLRDTPKLESTPLIYHLDVGAMYPNIILTNRLQPMSMVDEGTCAACDFNRPGKRCQRTLNWHWRGKYYPITRSEYDVIKTQLSHENVKVTVEEAANQRDLKVGMNIPFKNLNNIAQHKRINKRVGIYSSKVYRRTTHEIVEEKAGIICQRENPFYVNTVRDFRDRRYIYKGRKQGAEREEREAKTELDKAKAKDLVLLWDSLQLAHKCILNSFYGYVMRKGARWRSIEMAGVVTKTGADIIKAALNLVEKLGRPLELDTDGIWAILPACFPEEYKFHTQDSLEKKSRPLNVSYPCVILNKLVNDKFANEQYQDLDSQEKKTYTIRRECTIFFEVDGPYRAMVLPAAQQEGKDIKKRYAVFNKDGSLAELKGFEIKRRGELKLIKIFQGQIFGAFLDGETLKECYDAVASISNHWLDICYNKGSDLEDDDVFDLISENKTMKEAVSSYGDRKSTSITTALRLSEFLGAEMAESKGLNCQFVIANRPVGGSTSTRAIPVAIWSAKPAVKKKYLRKWLQDASLNNFDVRDVIDWDYYIGRLSSAIQKIITIPAAFQNIPNPVSRVKHPDWLVRVVHDRNDVRKQTRMSSFFKPQAIELQENNNGQDIEDIMSSSTTSSPMKKRFATVSRKPQRANVNLFHDGSIHDKSLKEEKDDNEDEQIQIDSSGLDDIEMVNTTEIKQEDSFANMGSQCPDWKTQAKEALDWQKKNWQLIRKKRMARMEQENSEIVSASRVGVKKFFQSKAAQMKNEHWEVIQIQQETAVGVFSLWIVANKQLQRVRVRVDRVFYVNTTERNETAEAMGTLVTKNLPRGRKSMFLYEIMMSEHDYQNNAKDISAFLTHDSVEGVYETKIPLMFSLMMDLGCVVKLKPNCGADPFQIFQASDLEFKSTAECPYLTDAAFQKIYVYHSQCGDRGIFGVFMEGESPQCLVICVNPPKSSDKMNFTSAMRSAYRLQFDIEGSEESQEELEAMMPKFEFIYRGVKSKDTAFSQIKDFLLKNSVRSQSSIMIAETTETLEMLHMHIPILKTNYPVLCIAPNAVDSKYPPLSWVRVSVHRMMQRYFRSATWFKEQLELCQYAHVPIGNLGRDSSVLVSDIFFARALRENDHILWLSPSPKPDLAGVEEDENYFETEFSNPEIVKPGAYRTICVEMDLNYVETNTILVANVIEESNLMTEQEGESAFVCRDAFKVLQSVVSNWLNQASRNGNEKADTLLRQMYRWLRNTTSLLHDPELLRMIHQMMDKVLLKLVSKFIKLRAVVVYASFTKLIICTQKESIAAALAYLNYVNDTIQKDEVFRFILMETVRMWESLLFMDINNHGGLVPVTETREALTIQQQQEENDDNDEDDEDSDSDPELAARNRHSQKEIKKSSPKFSSSQPITQPDEMEPELISHWNLPFYLPKLAADWFLVITSEFLTLPHEFKRKSLIDFNSQIDSPETRKADFQTFMEDLVIGHFQQKLCRIVGDLQHVYHGDVRAWAEQLTAMPSAQLTTQNPVLEFIKFVTHVFSLDTSIQDQAIRLRESLMKMIKVKNYSKEGTFHDPCLSYVLPGVICSFCNACRDLDLCRDPLIISKRWTCAFCEHAYDIALIEAMLVQVVSRRSVAYQVQDMICVACDSVKMATTSLYCECSGRYRCKETRQEFLDKMRAFENIAKYYGFEWLTETVEWITQ